MTRGRALAAGSVLVVSAVVGGCESAPDPAPSATPTPSTSTSSASPSASPSPTPTETSTIPAAAQQRTPEGAEAFVKFFFDQYNEAWTRPEAGLISALSSPRCEFCTKAEKTSQVLLERGDRYGTAPVTVQGTKPLVGAPEPEAYIYVELLQNKSQVLAPDGSVVHSDPKLPIPSNVAVRWTGGRWVVVAVEAA